MKINLNGAFGAALIWVPVIVLLILGTERSTQKVLFTWAALIALFAVVRVVVLIRKVNKQA